MLNNRIITRFYTPNMYTQLMDSREHNKNMHKLLRDITTDRDALKAKVHELSTELERVSRELARV